MKHQISKVVFIATLTFIGFAGTHQAKATTPCPPGSADSCSYTTLPPCVKGVVLAPYTAGYTTSVKYPNGTPIVVNGTYSCTNAGLALLTPPTYTKDCRDCDGDCVPHYGKYWQAQKACSSTCTVVYNNPVTGGPTTLTAGTVAYGVGGVENWFEVTGDCGPYTPGLHPLGPKP